MKDICISAPAGSGNTFCQSLLFNNTKANYFSLDHEAKSIKANKHNIYLLRNPYDCVASATERHYVLNDKYFDQMDRHQITDLESINHFIEIYTEKYKDFLFYTRYDESIFKATFEYLTNNSESLISRVVDFFDIERTDKFNDQEVIESIKDSGMTNRVPREKSEDRKLIDKMTLDNEELAIVYKFYLDYKQILQSTEI